MVVCSAEHILQADIIFVIENTAVNGAYINDLKSNYIIPTLEYFSQGNIDESNYVSDNANALYGIVTYQAADCLPHPSSDTYGPFSSPGKVLGNIERLELIGGKGESHANIAEGLATALCCFDDLEEKRDVSSNPQKHCILICNSPPYLLPSMESPAYAGKNVEQLAALLQERNINLSIISPRKIPQLYKLFEKAGGDLGASQTKNYAKDPRHLVLLKGFSLKERPISPPPCVSSSQSQIPTTTLPMTSLPSPLASNDSPLSANTQATQNMLGNSTSGPVGVSPIGQAPVYRPPNPQGMTQPMVSPGMVNTARGNMMSNMQMPMQTLPAPPGYHTSPAGMGNRPPPRWSMPPPQPQPQRPYMPGQQVNTTQGSALIAQLTQPPTSLTGTVNQFGQIGSNSPLSAQQQQQQQMRMTQQQNIQTSMAPTVPMQQTSNTSQVTAPVQAVTSQAQQQAVQQPSQQLNAARERHTIWQGLLEWIEKPKNPTDQQKITKHVPCQVSANSKNGEPELKADGWPSKLIMQLMPKQLIGSIGGAYLKNSKSVLFHPQNCEALESLTKVMSSGFAGCVHFTSNPNPPACDIKVLILLYTSEKRAYLGFIPNDQGAFVDRLRKVIQEQKSTQMMRQGQAGGGSNMNQQGPVSMGGTPPQMPGANVVTSQSAPQQGLMMSQTNTMTMGGGQLTQNVVTSTGQPGGGIGGVLGQNLPGGGMQPRMRMQGIQQGLGPQGNQQVGPASNIAPGMMGAPGQRPQFENQLQVERQQNLEKINQLKQTLEAAQQQEQQYKSQLERISHMKTSQLQEALQIAQQQEMQYQRLANQTNQAAANAAAQQQRMMRPVISNNPGLRHLLQAQPQYRQQMLGMQQMGGSTPRPQMGQQMQNTGNATQGNFDDVPNFDYM